VILLDLPQPGNFDAVGYRVAWTAAGVGIGVLVMLLAGLLASSPPCHSAATTSQTTGPNRLSISERRPFCPRLA
jgi:hypothetical protein